jgi:hypothetical protein
MILEKEFNKSKQSVLWEISSEFGDEKGVSG